MKDGDIILAHRLAHTLKGNAGQIGEKQLQEAASSIEEILADGKNSNLGALGQMQWLDKQMPILENAMELVLAKLAPMFSEADTEKKAEPLRKEKSLELLTQLESMLKEKNPECINLLDDIRVIPETEKLAQLTEDFAFNEAINELSNVKKNL